MTIFKVMRTLREAEVRMETSELLVLYSRAELTLFKNACFVNF